MALESDHEAVAGWGAAGPGAAGHPRAPLPCPQLRPALVIRVLPAFAGQRGAPALRTEARRPPGPCPLGLRSNGGGHHRGQAAAPPGAVRALHACELGRSGSGGVARQRPLPRKGKELRSRLLLQEAHPGLSLLLEAAGQVVGRGGLWGPLSPLRRLRCGFLEGGRSDVWGALSAPALLVRVLSGGLSLSGPRLPIRGGGFLPPARVAAGRPRNAMGAQDGTAGPAPDASQLPLPGTHPRLRSLPGCGWRPCPGTTLRLGRGGQLHRLPRGSGPPGALALLGGGGPFDPSWPCPRGSLSPLPRGPAGPSEDKTLLCFALGAAEMPWPCQKERFN